ncbi:hypothetical protein [Rhodoferax ferrireducens]|uniref:portal protein n=1 Tax=Rhodoferax ferrireducens TaxID=192843 RepID=UPI000E0D742D|nr:hypothetical protein [Rhodoferax ferrireducens]
MTTNNTKPDDNDADDQGALSAQEVCDIQREIEEQPAWRARADKEMDYADGNQLASELLRRQQELGIPPAIEDLVGPALLSIQGYEIAKRTDWRVTPNGQPGGQDVADGLNFKLNQAERESKADDAITAAFRPQAAVGLGFVEVSRESDPFKYAYRCTAIHRNEIHWDNAARETDLSDARWMRRTRWLRPERLASAFPKHKEMIMLCGKHGSSWINELALDGGASTGLSNAWGDGSAPTIGEQHWYNISSKELCVSEIWYRRWKNTPVLKFKDERVVEYDEDNMEHVNALAAGECEVVFANVARVRRSYWLGTQRLDDAPSPYSHRHFIYVPFWGFREDLSGVPYGYVRGMVYQQDSLNSGTAKLRWGLSAVRTTRTKGATSMTSAQLRKAVGRADADIELNADHMAKPGAIFKVERDFQLNAQQMQLLDNARAAIVRVGPASNGFQGKDGTATSGVQEQTQVDQSNQSLGWMMDMRDKGRKQVGELLISMIMEDIGSNEHTIVIEGDGVREDKTVILNKPEVDEDGKAYLSNDLQRTRLKVGLEEVPSTTTFRGQQVNAMAEAVKSLPEQYKAAIMPFMVSLMEVPFKKEVIEAIRAVDQQQSPDQIEQRVKQAVQEALVKAGNDLKARELDMKERKTEAEINAIVAQAVQTGVASAFSAMQAANQIILQPQVAPVADAIMQGAGYKLPSPGGDDPNFPTAGLPAAPMDPAGQPSMEVVQNTSPGFPPIPQQAASPMQGIETARTTDNLAEERAEPAGMNESRRRVK